MNLLPSSSLQPSLKQLVSCMMVECLIGLLDVSTFLEEYFCESFNALYYYNKRWKSMDCDRIHVISVHAICFKGPFQGLLHRKYLTVIANLPIICDECESIKIWRISSLILYSGWDRWLQRRGLFRDRCAVWFAVTPPFTAKTILRRVWRYF